VNAPSTRSPVKVSISNFQSIENLNIEIDGFTCITGKSNIGKSAIIRAIFRSAVNKPVTGAVRSGAKFCTVEIESAGWGYRWEKGERGVNRYVIPGKAEVLDKVGQSQVAEIEDMGFGSIQVGDKKLYPWYASQFDPIFLMGESGPAVTSFLSSVAGLDRIQDSIVYASRMKRSSMEAAKAREGTAASVRAKEAKLSAVDDLESLHSDIEDQVSSILEYEEKITRMSDVSRAMAEARAVLTSLEPASGVKVPKDVLSEPMRRMAAMSRHSRAMMAAALRIVPIRAVSEVSLPESPKEDLERLHKLRRVSSIGPIQASVRRLDEVSETRIPEMNPAMSQALRLSRLRSVFSRLEKAAERVRSIPAVMPDLESPSYPDKLRKAISMRDQIRTATAEIGALEGKLTNVDDEIVELRVELAKIPSCPTCGRVTTHIPHVRDQGLG
jgi:hypothetical protein